MWDLTLLGSIHQIWGMGTDTRLGDPVTSNSRSICPAALRGRGALRRPRWTTSMSKVDLAVWRRPARAACQVLMTKFLCFALAAADMKHVRQVESRSVSV